MIADSVILTVLQSVQIGGSLENNPFAEELGKDDLLIHGSILNSLGCNTAVRMRSSREIRARDIPQNGSRVSGWRVMRTTDTMTGPHRFIGVG